MNVKLTNEQEQSALAYYPFGGEEDVSDLDDKFVTGRKSYECLNCGDTITEGERHRALKQRNNEDRKIMTFRFCGACSLAAAIADDDGLRSYSARTALNQVYGAPK